MFNIFCYIASINLKYVGFIFDPRYLGENAFFLSEEKLLEPITLLYHFYIVKLFLFKIKLSFINPFYILPMISYSSSGSGFTYKAFMNNLSHLHNKHLRIVHDVSRYFYLLGVGILKLILFANAF